MTLCNLVKDFAENKSVTKLRLHCNWDLETFRKSYKFFITPLPTVKVTIGTFYPLQPPESTATIYATWTPKHNGVLKTCMASGTQKEVETDEEYLARIVKSWRSKFPKSSVLGESFVHSSFLKII